MFVLAFLVSGFFVSPPVNLMLSGFFCINGLYRFKKNWTILNENNLNFCFKMTTSLTVTNLNDLNKRMFNVIQRCV